MAGTAEGEALAACSDLYHFFRVSALGATATLPLLGAASVDRRLPPWRAAALLTVAAAFHAFAYVHNDVCDLALDRTQPRRAMYPLVQGRITPPTALAVALACVPLAFTLDALLIGEQWRPGARIGRRPGDQQTPQLPPAQPHRQRQHAHPLTRSPAHLLPPRQTYLAVAFALLAAYNRWGKACPLPPLTDLMQGLGWAALVRYGAAAAGAPPTALTELLAAYELLLIAMVNGVHGALRDLENDARHGARTTAIVLGARAGDGGAPQVSGALLAYAGALQAALLALPAWAAARNVAGHTAGEHTVAVATTTAIAGTTLAVLVAASRSSASAEAGMAHVVLLLSAPLVIVAPGMRSPTFAILLAAHLLPLLPNGLTYDALRWALGIAREL